MNPLSEYIADFLVIFLAIVAATFISSKYIEQSPAVGASTVSHLVEETCLEWVKNKYPAISSVGG